MIEGPTERPAWTYPCVCGHSSNDHNDNGAHTAIPYCLFEQCECGEFGPYRGEEKS